jgi:hypothetical protein
MARAVLVAFVLALLGAPVLAADPPAPAKGPRQVPLSAARVEQFIASYEPVKALNEKYDKDWGDENFADPSADGATQMRQSLQAHGALDAFNALVARYGFRGAEDWWPVACSTMIAYGFSDPAHDPAKVNAQLTRRLAGLDADPKLTAAQKAQLKPALETALANYEAMKPPPGNIEVVRPYRARLARLLREKNP